MRFFRVKPVLTAEYRERKEGLYEIFNEAVARAAASRQAEGAVPVIGLSGGTTPGDFYASLASFSKKSRGPAVNWEQVSFFLGDERHAPLDSPLSNYNNAKASLCADSAIPESRIRPLAMELTVPRLIAAEYEGAVLEATRGSGALDILILGMGADGHTASLFPRTLAGFGLPPANGFEREKNFAPGDIFISHYAPEQAAVRYTLTPQAIMAARSVIIIVTGEAKSETLKAAMAGNVSPREIPAAIVFDHFKSSNRPLLLLTDINPVRRECASL